MLRVGDGSAILPPNINGIHLEFAKTKWASQGVRVFWREYMKSLKYHNPRVPIIVNRIEDPLGPATLSIYFEGQPKSIADRPLTLPSPDLSSESAKAGSDIVVSPSSLPTAGAGTGTGTGTPLGAETSFGRRTIGDDDPWAAIHSHACGGSPAPPARVGETRIQIDAKFKKPGELWTEFMKKSGARPVELTKEDKGFLEWNIVKKVTMKLGKQTAAEHKAYEAEKKARLDAAIAEAAALKQM